MRENIFTVIMSVYNSSTFLDDSINSILNQTYKHFTFIICDDGSTDNSSEILLKWANKDSRIKLIKNDFRMGLAYSLNKCIKNVETQYIVRMDSDDISKVERLSILADFVSKNIKFDIIGSNYNIIDFKNVIINNNVEFIEKPSIVDILLNRSFCHPTTVIKTSFIRKMNGYFVDKKNLLYQDLEFWLRSKDAGAKMVNINKKLLNYRTSNRSFFKRNLKSKFNLSRIKLKWANNKPLKIIFVSPFIFLDLLKGLINEFRIILHKKL
jgi:glycosyltransferase EpsE